jgi:hypothetical protein
VVDKATKLETIYDRVHTVDARFDVLRQAARADFAEAKLAAFEADEPNANAMAKAIAIAETEYAQTLVQIDTDQKLVRHANIGGEFMSADDQQRICAIAAQPMPTAPPTSLLSD